jgi:hypothetical protein
MFITGYIVTSSAIVCQFNKNIVVALAVQVYV